MHSTTRKFASLFSMTAILLVIPCLSGGNICLAQKVENPAPSLDRERPTPISLDSSTLESFGSQHSILEEETEQSNPAHPRKVETSSIQASATNSPVADEAFANQGTSGRLEGTGGNALGTFAISSQSSFGQNPSTSRTFNDDFQQFPATSETQNPRSNQQQRLPPITSNGLRGSGIDQSQPASQPPQIPSTRFGDSQTWDEQPQPPQSATTQSGIGFSGQGRGFESPTLPQLERNQFNGPLGSAPPIHNAPSDREDNSIRQPVYDQNTVFDSNIATTQYQQSVSANERAVPAQKIDLSLAKKIMQRYQIDSAPDPLPGRPVKLQDVLESTPQHLQKKVINQYWETYYDWATMLNSRQQLDWLRQIPSPLNRGEVALLNTAKSSAKNRLLAHEIQLGKSQAMLQQLMSNQDDLLPLPSDNPLIQKYDTHYDWYESRNRLPEELRGIDIMLAKSVQLIADRSNTVGTARNALSQIRTAYAANPRELGSILEAARFWSEAEQSLVGSIVNYNQAIADYSLTISPGYKRPEQIAAMLIAKPQKLSTQQGQQQTAERSSTPSGQNFGQNQNFGQSRFQNASQQRSPGNQNSLNGQNNNYQNRDDPISRSMNRNTDLSPNGYSGQRSSQTPPSTLQPSTYQGQQKTSPPTNQGQPNSYQPSAIPSIKPPVQQNPVGDRSAFRGDRSFGGSNNSRFNAPKNIRGMSESAKEFNSFGR